MFRDRQDAGRRLAAALAPSIGPDALVLALPRGGVPVGFEIASAVGCELDILVARKLGVPGYPELAFGAIAEGERVMDAETVASMAISQGAIRRVEEAERIEARRRTQVYRGKRPPPRITGRTVVLVDDGVATGSTARAALQAVRRHRPARLVFAAPVGPPDTVHDLEALADQVVVLETPRPFAAVGLWYEEFGQTSDDEVLALLRASNPPVEHDPGPGMEVRRAHVDRLGRIQPAKSPPDEARVGDGAGLGAPRGTTARPDEGRPPRGPPPKARSDAAPAGKARRDGSPADGVRSAGALPSPSSARPSIPDAARGKASGRVEITSREVSIPVGAQVVDATVDVPPAARGVVLFAHGLGSGRHSPRNGAVAGTLRQRGFATVLVDLLTPDEAAVDARTREHRFDIPLLAARLRDVMAWIAAEPGLAGLPTGLFGSSTGAAAALVAAAGTSARAVVSRGGRPDLAGPSLDDVKAATLLLVGGNDPEVLALNRGAQPLLGGPNELVVIPGATHLFEEPGALDEVARHAAAWFERHLTASQGAALAAENSGGPPQSLHSPPSPP